MCFLRRANFEQMKIGGTYVSDLLDLVSLWGARCDVSRGKSWIFVTLDCQKMHLGQKIWKSQDIWRFKCRISINYMSFWNFWCVYLKKGSFWKILKIVREIDSSFQSGSVPWESWELACLVSFIFCFSCICYCYSLHFLSLISKSAGCFMQVLIVSNLKEWWICQANHHFIFLHWDINYIDKLYLFTYPVLRDSACSEA